MHEKRVFKPRYKMQFDTIAAISTAQGFGGISIVRISGPEAFDICSSIFTSPSKTKIKDAPSFTIHYGSICHTQTGEAIDEVLVSKMSGPKSYTREDIIEINCHGGLVPARLVLELVVAKGARLAEAGEFTKRAFLNGRIDLSQAEAVGQMVEANSEMSLAAAMSQLSGATQEAVDSIKGKLVGGLAEIEVAIQYPEYDDLGAATDEQIAGLLEESIAVLRQLASTYKKGQAIREGVKAVIIGKPNVGKSMLLNRLLGKDRAIVADFMGTTRDVIDDWVTIRGLAIRFYDTAGIRETSGIEQLGVDRSIAAIDEADLIIFVVDASQPLDSQDKSIYEMAASKPERIIALNKSDLGANPQTKAFFSGEERLIEVSAKDNTNVGVLAELVADASGAFEASGMNFTVTLRHKLALESAAQALSDGLEALKKGFPIDFVETDINDCLYHLGQITGESAPEEIIDEIFSRFCIGK
ncbi:MAG: tRNA uridine-5-carboxymethylaminomethyl(34) synthesis GTPase MnmE [Eubacteriaceae bacterium]|nr:tRNA uridine-5-carboxymethylaminomethyl(34) synthesis GTPase MnmE [Eubacteriaceae bacterium]